MLRVVVMMLIGLNVGAVLLESMPSVNARLGGATAHDSAPAFQYFEAFSGSLRFEACKDGLGAWVLS